VKEELNLRRITPAFRTFCGEHALDALPRELGRVGAQRAVVISVPPLRDHPDAMSRLYAALGERLVGQFDGVVEHSPLPAVDQARQFLAAREADAVIAVGGGSSVVTARAATILHTEQRDIRELCTHRSADGKLVSPKLAKPKLPLWVVPTTPTTAYAKAGAAVRDPGTGERLPHAMRFNADVIGHRAATLAAVLGSDTSGSAGVIEEIERLSVTFGVPTRLRDIGVTDNALVEAADHAMDDWAITAGPRVPDREDVLELLTEAW
jgi:alcohol dehydrogenase class IV